MKNVIRMSSEIPHILILTASVQLLSMFSSLIYMFAIAGKTAKPNWMTFFDGAHGLGTSGVT